MLDVFPDFVAAELRALLRENYPHRCVIQTPVEGTTPTGGEIVDYTDRELDVPCRMSALSGDEKETLIGAQPTTQRRYTVSMGAEHEILTTWRLVVTGTTQKASGPAVWTKYLNVDALVAPDRAAEVERKVLTTETAGP
jgi:hypothetical protein